LLLHGLTGSEGGLPPLVLLLYFLLSLEEIVDHIVNIFYLIHRCSQGHHFILNFIDYLFLASYEFCQQFAANKIELFSQLLIVLVLDIFEKSESSLAV
jgi:hypothetical protein